MRASGRLLVHHVIGENPVRQMSQKTKEVEEFGFRKLRDASKARSNYNSRRGGIT